MDKFTTRPLQDGDVEALLKGMRACDREEVRAMVGDGYEDWLRETIPQSELLWAGMYGGEFGSILGASEIEPGIGSPWLLATDVADKNPAAVLECGMTYVPKMLERFPRLFNYVDARNKKSIRWLKRIGFTILPPEPVGSAGALFHGFFQCAPQV